MQKPCVVSRAIVCAITVICAFSAVSNGDATYNLVPLGSLGGNSFTAGINNQGQIVGWSNLSPTSPEFHAFLYSNGVMQDIGANTTQNRASSINNSGEIVGAAVVGAYYEACTFSSGQTHRLTTADYGSYALSVNSAGTIVGYENPNNFYDQPVIFQNGSYQALPTLPNGEALGYAESINSSGQISGEDNYNESDGGTHPFLYSGGQTTDLFAGTTGNTGHGSAINNSGEICGDMNGHTYIDQNGTITYFNAYQALAINSSGTVVGTANNGDGMIYSNGVVQDLNALIAPGSGWTIQEATGINDSGVIAAWASKGNVTEAVELVPTPEPGTLRVAGLVSIFTLLWIRPRGRTNPPVQPRAENIVADGQDPAHATGVFEEHCMAVFFFILIQL